MAVETDTAPAPDLVSISSGRGEQHRPLYSQASHRCRRLIPSVQAGRPLPTLRGWPLYISTTPCSQMTLLRLPLSPTRQATAHTTTLRLHLSPYPHPPLNIHTPPNPSSMAPIRKPQPTKTFWLANPSIPRHHGRLGQQGYHSLATRSRPVSAGGSGSAAPAGSCVA